MPFDFENKLIIGLASSALFDLSESDTIYRTEGPEAYRKFQSKGLDVFVRSLVGLDREAAKAALAAFMAGKTLAANQIEFLNLIVNHLTEHGIIEAAALYESPFVDLSPQGPESLFTIPQLDELMLVLEDVYVHAVA